MEAVNLTVEKISFAGSFEIIRDFNAVFEPGINIIYGGPGSGKTTLLQALAGLRKLKEGRVRWEGNISMVSQMPEREFLHADCAGELNAAFNSCGENQITADLKKLGLPRELLSLSPWSLSKGEKKRLAILRAFREYSGQKRVLIVDDPFCDLDFKGRRAVAKMFKSSQQEIIITATNRREDLDLIQDMGLSYKVITV